MRTPNNIEKPIPGRGDNEATKEILLAVDKEKIEFDAMNDMLDTLIEEFKKELEEEYGAVNINLEDGTYTEIKQEEEVDVGHV